MLTTLTGEEGDGGGNIFIRGGQFEMTNSTLSNATVKQGSGVTDIQVDNLTLRGGANIDSSTYGTGQGGSIALKVIDSLTVSGQDAKGHLSGIYAHSANQGLEKAGDAGNIEIEARQITLTNGGQLSTDTFGTGQGGSILLKGIDTLTLSGDLTNQVISGISASSNNEEIAHAGNAGNIEIEVRQINLTENGLITSNTVGSGKGGKVILHGVDTLIVDKQSFIMSSSFSSQDNAGDAGNIEIEARQIMITNGGGLSSGSFGTGQSGSILLKGVDTLTVSGGKTADEPVSTINAGSYNKEVAHAGDAGNIEIEARQILLTNEGSLISGTSGTGRGGFILLKGVNILTIIGGGHIDASSGSNDQKIAQAGDAGNIEIEAHQITLAEHGSISSFTTDEGKGGKVILRYVDT